MLYNLVIRPLYVAIVMLGGFSLACDPAPSPSGPFEERPALPAELSFLQSWKFKEQRVWSSTTWRSGQSYAVVYKCQMYVYESENSIKEVAKELKAILSKSEDWVLSFPAKGSYAATAKRVLPNGKHDLRIVTRAATSESATTLEFWDESKPFYRGEVNLDDYFSRR